jgi:hypothetical protein
MKKLLVVLAAAFATVAFYATPAFAAEEGNCPHGDASFGSSGTWDPDGVPDSGDEVTVTIASPNVTFSESVTFCVKAGNFHSGVMTGSSFTVTWLNNGGQVPGISHDELYIQPGGTDTTTTTTTTDTGGPTTDTGGPTTDTGGPTTDTGGPTTDTGGPTTTGSGGISGGTTGGTGGTTGGTASTGGELPFTGLPVWIPLLAAAALLASGIFLVRRRKGELS